MIIGFVGNMRSGKTTAAKLAKEMFDGKVYSFAQPLKQIATTLGQENRLFLQKMGAALREIMGENIWVQNMAKRAVGANMAAITPGL